MERHAPLPLPSDLEKSCPRAYILGIPNLICEHILDKDKDKDKNKEALFNVAYNVTDNISS